MSESLEILVQRLKNEDLTALGQVYELLNKKVFNRCLFLLKDRSLAEDATQDIFLKMFTRIRSLESASKLEGWLNQMTYNHCMDYFRKKKKLSEISITENLHAFDDSFLSEVDEVAESEEKRALLLAEISKLKEMDRMILLMHYWEGYSIKEISEQLEIGESALKMRLMRTRNKIKESFEKKGIHYSLEMIILLILNLF